MMGCSYPIVSVVRILAKSSRFLLPNDRQHFNYNFLFLLSLDRNAPSTTENTQCTVTLDCDFLLFPTIFFQKQIQFLRSLFCPPM